MGELKLKLKCMVISHLNKLENVLYITRNLRISTFQCNWNHIKIPYVYDLNNREYQN